MYAWYLMAESISRFTLNFDSEEIPGWLIHISILLISYANENLPFPSFWGKYLAARLKSSLTSLSDLQ